MRPLVLALPALLTVAACDAESPVITPEDLSGVFVRRSACDDVALTPALASLVGQSDGSAAASSSVLSCERSASSCEELWRCSGIDPETSCDPASFTSTCEGTERVTCSNGRVRRQDCAADDDGNTACNSLEAGVTSCGLGPCEGASGLRCEGDVIYACREGLDRRSEDCALAGRTCVVDEALRAGCVDRVEPCAADRCDGAVALRCVAGLGFVETDCAATPIAGACRARSGEAECFAASSECEEGAAGCAGALARFCVAGRWIELDCGAFEDGTCVDESADGAVALRCARG